MKRARSLLLLLSLVLVWGCTPTPSPPAATLTPTIVPSTPTPTALALTETPQPVCTPPACGPDEVYFCPDTCPGGCGTTCATPTPAPGAGSPAATIAYAAQGNLWIVTEAGDSLQLTAAGSDRRPRISPDGRALLFEREVPPGPADLPRFELWVIDTDGSDARRLVGPDDLPGEMGTPMGASEEVKLDRLPAQIAWLPGGDRVAFNSEIYYGYGAPAPEGLWTVDVASGALTQVLPVGEGGVFAYSPDGAALLVATPTSISMMNADGSNRRTLVTFDFVNTASEYAYVPMPAWAPDGSYALALISSAEPFGEEQPSGDLWRLPREGDAMLLGTLPGRFLFNTMDARLFSPDLSQLAYVLSENGAAGTLYVAPADGSQGAPYTGGVFEFLAWGPGGQRFTFLNADPQLPYLGEVGQEPVAILAPEGDVRIGELRWLDAGMLVYTTGRPPTFTLKMGPAAGGEDRTLAEGVEGFDVRVNP